MFFVFASCGLLPWRRHHPRRRDRRRLRGRAGHRLWRHINSRICSASRSGGLV